MALWAHWQHVGWLEASKPCELLTLDAELFLQIVLRHPEPLASLASVYSSTKLKAIEEETRKEMVNDLHLPIQHDSIVSAMPLAARRTMSDAALLVLDRQSHWNARLPKNAFEDLQKEIQTGECDVYVDDKERVQRIVTIVALRLEKQDGSVVAQIGKCHRGEASARCTYPGTKIKVGEFPRDAIERLVNGKLCPYKDGLVWGTTEVDEEFWVSKKFALNSKYIRTVFHAKLQHGFDPVENTLSNKPTLVRAQSVSSETSSISEVVHSDRRAFTLGNMETVDSTFIFAWLMPADQHLLENSEHSDRILKKWISEVELRDVEELSKTIKSTAE